MTKDLEAHRSRAETDARARAARLALERDAGAPDDRPPRLAALWRALAELWQRLPADPPEPQLRPTAHGIDTARLADSVRDAAWPYR